MQILEHQSLFLYNVISYKTFLPLKKIPEITSHLHRSIRALGVDLTGNIMLRKIKDDANKNFEVLMPVSEALETRSEYTYKPIFKLLHAVTIRHEGNYMDIEKTEKKLIDYINKNSYQIVTMPYYSIVRLDNDNINSCIVDIYIGINYNIL